MITLDETRRLMSVALRGVDDLSGLPIADHCLRVECTCPPWFSHEARQVAILHDTVEDSDIRLRDLEDRGFSSWVVRELDCITQRPGETYAEYLDRLIAEGHPDTLLVKMLDNRDNLLPWRMTTLTDKQRDYLNRRYDGVHDLLFTAWTEKHKTIKGQKP